jgi:anti-anti-sigma factor
MINTENGKQPSKINSTRVGASNVITPGESLTYQNREQLDAILEGLINRNRTRIVLDFKNVFFMDSEALELLIDLHSTLKNRGGILKFVGLSPVCRDILTATRLINVFHIHDDLAEALRSSS